MILLDICVLDADTKPDFIYKWWMHKNINNSVYVYQSLMFISKKVWDRQAASKVTTELISKTHRHMKYIRTLYLSKH